MLTDDDVDQLLRENAVEWRAHTDTDARVDLASVMNDEAPSSSRRAIARLMAAGVLLTVIAVAVVIGRPALVATPSATPTAPSIAGTSPSPSQVVVPSASVSPTVTPSATAGRPTASPSPSPSSSPQSLQPEEIKPGDRVVGLGQVIAVPGSQPYLCADVLATGFDLPACGMSLLVDVFDFDPRSVAGSDHSGIWLTRKVELHGTWQGNGLHVTSANVAEPSGFPIVPCASPPGGWPGIVGDINAERDDLNRYFNEHIDRLIGPWLATVDGHEPTPDGKILVVGTIDDPADIYAELAELYPSNLCVTHVDYSFSKLMDIERSIGPANGRFVTDIDDPGDRLVIKPYMLTRAVVDQLADYLSYCNIEPLIRLED